ncbi:MAG: pentapeptide repeat-containing protein [Treponema sp.]|jgi:uncharacterized protein YjbI with pentapeptide repeats|nr:pentapeptide repeat-containing protein [Treponema sp.]
MNIWAILGIKKTNDITVIRNAYSEKVKIVHPEDDPQGFAQLKDAYKAAIKAASAPEKQAEMQNDEIKEQSHSSPPEPEETKKETPSAYNFSSLSNFWRQIMERDKRSGRKTSMKEILSQVENLKNEYLLKTEALFVANAHTWFADFQKHFLEICEKIKGKNMGYSISYLEYICLNTHFINRRYVAEICAYNKNRFFDKKQQHIGGYDISYFLIYYDQLWNDLIAWNNFVEEKVSSQEITQFILEAIPDFYSYLTNIIRFGLRECVDTPQFKDIEKVKGDTFRFCVGDYMAQTTFVYCETEGKDAALIFEDFHQRKKSAHNCRDYSTLDFSNKDLCNIKATYSNFRKSILNNVNLKESTLTGADFTNAQMTDCDLDYSEVHEASFANAILKNASFICVRAAARLPHPRNKWRHVGFFPVNFENAVLTKANFNNADFHRANFKNAQMKNSYLRYGDFSDSDFSGADLSGADLSNADFSGANFTGAKLSAVNFSSANLEDAVFLDADLSGTLLRNANLHNAVFHKNKGDIEK